jgi:hypothetical protein
MDFCSVSGLAWQDPILVIEWLLALREAYSIVGYSPRQGTVCDVQMTGLWNRVNMLFLAVYVRN